MTAINGSTGDRFLDHVLDKRIGLDDVETVLIDAAVKRARSMEFGKDGICGAKDGALSEVPPRQREAGNSRT